MTINRVVLAGIDDNTIQREVIECSNVCVAILKAQKLLLSLGCDSCVKVCYGYIFGLVGQFVHFP